MFIIKLALCILIIAIVSSSCHGLIYPCDVPTRECVSKYLSSVSRCHPVKDITAIKDYIQPFTYIESQYFNATYTRDNMKLSGLNDAEIVSFYIDEVNKLTYLNIHFNLITMSGVETLQLHRFNNSDYIIQTDFVKYLHNEDVTTVYDGIEELNFRNNHTKPFSGSIVFGLSDFPGLAKAAQESKFVEHAVREIAASMDVLAREEGFVIGKLAASIYIQYGLCTPY